MTSLQLIRFDGTRWVGFGDLVAELTSLRYPLFCDASLSGGKKFRCDN
jgi:hypothetical protein